MQCRHSTMTRCLIFQVLFVGLCVISDVYAGLCSFQRYERRTEYRGATPFFLNATRYYGPRTVYTWHKIHTNPDVDYPVFNTSNHYNRGSYLQFHIFSRQDEMTFRCSIHNGTDYEYPLFIDLKRIRIEPGPPVTSVIFYDGPEYRYVALRCTMTGKVEGDDIVYRWETPDGTPIPINPDRLYVDLNGTLHFTPIKFSDEGLYGITKRFVCHVFSEKLRGGQYGTPVSAVVWEFNRRNVPRSKPYLVYRSAYDVKVIEGRNAILECVFHVHVPFQKINYVWHVPSGINVTETTSKYGFYFKGRRLVIKGVWYSDGGIYACQAWNAWGFSHWDRDRPNNTFNVYTRCQPATF